jgi:hypothetical protein
MIGREAIAARARQHLGHREVAPNRSPLIDGWLRRCGVPPGLPWCAAFASWCVAEVPSELHLPPRVCACAGALRLGRMFPETRNPQLGDLMWFATDGKGAGHIGIVVAAIGQLGRPHPLRPAPAQSGQVQLDPTRAVPAPGRKR